MITEFTYQMLYVNVLEITNVFKDRILIDKKREIGREGEREIEREKEREKETDR